MSDWQRERDQLQQRYEQQQWERDQRDQQLREERQRELLLEEQRLRDQQLLEERQYQQSQDAAMSHSSGRSDGADLDGPDHYFYYLRVLRRWTEDRLARMGLIERERTLWQRITGQGVRGRNRGRGKKRGRR